MPRFDRVSSRRQVLQRKLSIFRSDRVVGILEHENVTLHPGVHVALHRYGHFGAAERVVDGSGTWRLRLIPLAIVFRHRVNVVGGLVVILDFECLAGHQGDDVGVVHATLLVEHDRLFGRVEVIVSETVLHVNHDVSQVAFIVYNDLRRDHGIRMRFLAIWLGAHVDGLRRHGLAIECYASGNGADRRGIDHLLGV